jgi:hypothetical protein
MSQSREGNFTGVAGPRRRFEAALRGARIAGPTGVDWEYYSSHRDGRVEDERGRWGQVASLRFSSSLIEPDVPISGIRLSD